MGEVPKLALMEKAMPNAMIQREINKNRYRLMRSDAFIKMDMTSFLGNAGMERF